MEKLKIQDLLPGQEIVSNLDQTYVVRETRDNKVDLECPSGACRWYTQEKIDQQFKGYKPTFVRVKVEFK